MNIRSMACSTDHVLTTTLRLHSLYSLPFQVQDDRTRLTTHFVSALPPLLNKFKQDMRKTGLLISVPQYFDVDVFTTNHKEEVCIEVIHHFRFFVFFLEIFKNLLQSKNLKKI
jgi:hypothetical protein